MRKFAIIGLATIAMVAAIGVGQASAAAITVPNFLFNNPDCQGNGCNGQSYTVDNIPDWGQTDNTNQYGVQYFTSSSYSSFPATDPSQTAAYTNDAEIILNSTTDPSF